MEELLFQEPEEGGERAAMMSMMTHRSAPDVKRLRRLCAEQLRSQRLCQSRPVTVIHHGLPGGEQRLLSLFGLGPLRVLQTVNGLGGCRSDAEMAVKNVAVQETIKLDNFLEERCSNYARIRTSPHKR